MRRPCQFRTVLCRIRFSCLYYVDSLWKAEEQHTIERLRNIQFHCCSSSGHCFEDHSHLRLLIRSTNI